MIHSKDFISLILTFILEGIPIIGSDLQLVISKMSYSKSSDHSKQTHGFWRSQVCLICFHKSNNFKKLVYVIDKNTKKKTAGAILKRVRESFFEEFDPDDPHFPYGLCSYCNNIINRNPTQLPAPYDFSVLKFPVLTRSSGAQSPYLDDYKDCDCGICKVGRENAGTVGHQFGKKSLHNLGRPPLQGPRVDLGLPKSFKVCRDCRQPLARGKPHPCNVQNRRKQLEEQMRNDPVWAEISASKVIKAKASAQSGSDSIKLATGGTPLTLSNPSVRKPTTKAPYHDSPIPAEQFQKLQAKTGVSDNTINEFASFIRQNLGRKSVESNLRLQLREKSHQLGDYFSYLNWPMDSHKKSERESIGKVDRDIVYVNDMDEFIQTLKDKRGYSSRTRFYLRIGIDGGGTSLKVTLNMIKIEDEFSSPVKKALDLGYKPTAFKESGVKKLQIIGFVEKVSESQKNLETLWQLINIDDLIETANSTVTFALDYKCGSSVLGIGPASSAFPCPYCKMPSCQFINDPTHCGEELLRTLGEIRQLASEYQAKAARSNAAKKLTSAPYKSCEYQPLMSRLPDSTLVIDIYPPPPLHTKLGIVNNLFDTLNGILVAKGHQIRGEKWTDSLNCTRTQYHGGQFVGNYCDKMLENLDKLESLLSLAGALNDCLPLLEAFKAFARVHKSCFQMTLQPTFIRDIQQFADAYVELCMYCRSLKVKCSEESIKVHGSMVHVRQFLERKKAIGFNYGLGYYSEEVSESAHYDWDKVWVGRGYKVDIGNPNYPGNAKEAITKYNSGHV